MLTTDLEDRLSRLSSIMSRKEGILIYLTYSCGFSVPNDALGTGDTAVEKNNKMQSLLSRCFD